MKSYTCNIGDQFGDWTIIDNTPVSKGGHTHVLARCKCGKEELKNLRDLIVGNIHSCRNCAARKRRHQINIGDKFFDWTVVGEPIYTSNKKVLKWLCECKCGARYYIQSSELVSPDRRLSCFRCAKEKAVDSFTLHKGRVGKLTIGKFNKIKKTAEVRNIPFEVTMEFLWDLFELQEGRCAITGDILGSINKSSLDRIDSKLGYIEGNVQWVTKQANLCKHILTLEELYDFCRKVLNHANQMPSSGLTSGEGSETNT